jgi:hypothetical protein
MTDILYSGNWEIPNLPSNARVVVEGGHFTMRRAIVKDTKLGPGVYYLDVPSSTPPLPYETLRVPFEGEATQCWVVLKLAENDRVARPQAAAGREIRAIEPASARYLATLRKTIALFESLKPKVARAIFCLLIGNLELPKELRLSFEWALSEDFMREIGRVDQAELKLLAESTCQNKGDQRVVRTNAKRIQEDAATAERVYREFGYTVLASQTDGRGFWLAADSLLDKRATGYPVIALTKIDKMGETKPSCAVTLAGKLFLLTKGDTTHHIVIYDAKDDELIRQKSIEGAIVASYFEPGVSVLSMIVVHGFGDGYSIDEVDPAAIRTLGRLPSHSALIKKATECAQEMGAERIENRTSDVCCEIQRL